MRYIIREFYEAMDEFTLTIDNDILLRLTDRVRAVYSRCGASLDYNWRITENDLREIVEGRFITSPILNATLTEIREDVDGRRWERKWNIAYEVQYELQCLAMEYGRKETMGLDVFDTNDEILD